MQRSQARDLSVRFADLLPLLLRDYATSTDADTPAGADGSNTGVFSRNDTGVFSRNIVWATQDYEDLGIHADQQITLDVLNANPSLIAQRTTKARDAQAVRTKERAEIFTPAWLVNFQNDVVDHAWSAGHEPYDDAIPDASAGIVRPLRPTLPAFDDVSGKAWENYVDRRVLEVACGEAPYLTSRYDATTGELLALGGRVGFFDRKLAAIPISLGDEAATLNWALRALRATFGFELQGDSLLLARLNLLASFDEATSALLGRSLIADELTEAAHVIARNVWQMDGLTLKSPSGVDVVLPVDFFDVTVANPPYQKAMAGTSDRQIYPDFMDFAFRVSPLACFVTPARFLFNAGKTSKKWNRQVLSDPHVSVSLFEADSRRVFPVVEVKGGIAVTLRDTNVSLAPIGSFIPDHELRSIVARVHAITDNFLDQIVFAPESYRFTSVLHVEYPQAIERVSAGHSFDVTTNCFDVLPEVFHDVAHRGMIGVLGRQNNRRLVKFIDRRYVHDHPNLNAWKVALAKSNGAGKLGEVLAPPVLLSPGFAHTQSFISIGAFGTRKEAEELATFLHTKFARLLLGSLKVTQDNKRAVWANVPNLVSKAPADLSIDWESLVPVIDSQLADFFGLSKAEKAFVNERAQEMPVRTLVYEGLLE
ncbi:Eco57I restriction-modification methylase domain-containing protein [Pauljensenia sp. OF14-1SRA]|uniref:Eco57I restriction-modification methylase domain-containing protein n=1 Tax=Pauljensenia sp. OF14-1SRA TaxID=2998062 RepID=UPI0022E73A92|nr:Eco57I restriction-modification methylase domain-containing protein [Pauljensenia sp. OF14-1SRA]